MRKHMKDEKKQNMIQQKHESMKVERHERSMHHACFDSGEPDARV